MFEKSFNAAKSFSRSTIIVSGGIAQCGFTSLGLLSKTASMFPIYVGNAASIPFSFVSYVALSVSDEINKATSYMKGQEPTGLFF